MVTFSPPLAPSFRPEKTRAGIIRVLRDGRSEMDEKDANRAGGAAEEMDRLARESYRAAVDRAFDLQKSNMRLSRRFFENWVETLEDHAELNRRTMRGLADLIQEQREVFREMSRESLDAYDGFVDSLSSYYEEVSQETEE
jgi:hypothetical protein